jgi:hypothetical protein
MHKPSATPTRRSFLGLLSGLVLHTSGIAWLGLGASARRAEAATSRSIAFSKAHLERSVFAYISPLRSDGAESSCHAELWYAWLDDSVVVIVASDRWKAKALDRGLSRARVWVGDHGVWKSWFGSHNDGFREAPHFDARVELSKDAALLERLLAAYQLKYPDEIDSWRERMRNGFADGSRALLRYRPISKLDLDTQR